MSHLPGMTRLCREGVDTITSQSLMPRVVLMTGRQPVCFTDPKHLRLFVDRELPPPSLCLSYNADNKQRHVVYVQCKACETTSVWPKLVCVSCVFKRSKIQFSFEIDYGYDMSFYLPLCVCGLLFCFVRGASVCKVMHVGLCAHACACMCSYVFMRESAQVNTSVCMCVSARDICLFTHPVVTVTISVSSTNTR